MEAGDSIVFPVQDTLFLASSFLALSFTLLFPLLSPNTSTAAEAAVTPLGNQQQKLNRLFL
jgi:hypothetical protein